LLGCGLASLMADIMQFGKGERRKLVVFGISAGFAAVFGTPIAGAIFGLEVLVAGRIVHDDLLPSFVSGVVSFQIATLLAITYQYNQIPILLQFDHNVLLLMLIAGLFFGLCSLYFY
jgi:H+/Cl- antiporter ClcA